MKKWKCKKSELVYDSKYFKVRKDIVELPDGTLKDWTYWDSTDSAMVLGKTEDGKLVMIRQYRYLVDDEVIEFPSGHLNDKENIESGARREFEEETGFSIETPLVKLGSFFETYGQLNRKIHMFFADLVIKSDNNLVNYDDVSENIKIELVNFEKAVKLARGNKIIAMGSALAVLLLKEKIEKREIIIT